MTRRTLIQVEKKAVAEIKVVDEPVTVVVSSKGWVRARTGHGHDPASFAFKAGDGLYGTFECRTVDVLIVFGSKGRVYSVPVASLPGARGDGQPITTLIDLESGTQPVHFFAGPVGATLLLAGTGGYGFLASVENLVSRQKAGKAFISVGEGETVCAPSHVSPPRAASRWPPPPMSAAPPPAAAS
jgi:topoisomerase IV subunit A